MNDRLIEEAVQKLAGTYLKDLVQVFVCKVDSVDKVKRTCDCTPIGGDAATSLPGVRLMVENNDGFLVIPSVGSSVVVALSTKGLAYIYQFSDIDEVLIYVEGTPNPTTFNLKQGLIQFNDGSFAGLVKVIELTQKLNNLENKVNDIITKYDTHTHAGVQTGGGSTATPSAIVTGTLTPTTQSEIENTLIKHGK